MQEHGERRIFIRADQDCIRCSYNLRGLRAYDRCPECGTQIFPAGRPVELSNGSIRAECGFDDQPMHPFPNVCMNCLRPTMSQKSIERPGYRWDVKPSKRHRLLFPLCSKCRSRVRRFLRWPMVILIALLPTVFVMTFGIGWAMGWSSTRIWEQLQFPVIKCWLILALPLALIHRLRFPLYASWCDATPSKTKEGHPIIIIWFRNQRFAKAWLDSWEDPIEIPT